MKLSSENNRITVTDNLDASLTKTQRAVFENWEMGFDAQARGVRFEDCPPFRQFGQKSRRHWREGWLAGAAVDRMKAGWLAPTHNPNQTNAIRN